MQETDKKDFSRDLRSLMSLYNKQADPDIFSIWWNVLEEYDLSEIKQAFATYAKREKYPPVPAVVIDLIPSARGISADEAWAHIPKHDYCGQWLNQRMATSMGIAMPIYKDGDNYGARKAFIDCYNALENDEDWFYSGGDSLSTYEHQQEEKHTALKMLEDRGWIKTSKKLQKLLTAHGSSETEKKLSSKQDSESLSITQETQSQTEEARHD